MRLTQKGQVTIPVHVRRALGVGPGGEVEFVIDESGVRLVVPDDDARAIVERVRGAGEGDLTTDEILALMRR